MTQDLMLKSASELSQMVVSRQVSSRELLEEAMGRYEAFNPQVNAITGHQIEQARLAADTADEATSRGESLGVFHGLPVTIKEAYDWVGTPSTWGNPEWADNFPNVNSPSVDRLIDAGAIIWAKPNVPFMLGDWQSYNEI